MLYLCRPSPTCCLLLCVFPASSWRWVRALIRHFAKAEVRFQGVHVGDRPDSKEGSETHVETMSSWTSLQSPFLDPIFQLTDAKGAYRRRWGFLGGGVFEIVQRIQMQFIKGK